MATPNPTGSGAAADPASDAGPLSPFALHFGRNLCRCRRQVSLSQEALARRASLHRTEIGLLERGERVPRIDTVVKVAGGLEVPPARLLEGIDWNVGSSVPGAFSVQRGGAA
jgi:transcriptional regulator with XRE-family HTH domain